MFQTTKGLLFRDAGIRDAVHALVEQRLLIFRRQVAIMRDPCIVGMGHEVHDILFQIGSSA